MNAGHHYAIFDLSECNGILTTGKHGRFLSVVRLHRGGVASDFVLQSTNRTFPFYAGHYSDHERLQYIEFNIN
jgi:hypothetical protein